MCDCDRALSLISLGLDGEETEAERRELEEHLAACPACRELARDLEELHFLLPELEEEVPEGFHQSVMDRVRRESPAPPAKQGRNGRLRQWISMAAVFAVILAGAGTLAHLTAGENVSPEAAASRSGPQSSAEPVETAEPFSQMSGRAAADPDKGLPKCVQAQQANDPTAYMAPFSIQEDAEGADKGEGGGERLEQLTANCAAWVKNSGLPEKDRIDTEQILVEPAAADPSLGLTDDGWRVTVGDPAGEDVVVLLCDGETLEVLGPCPEG